MRVVTYKDTLKFVISEITRGQQLALSRAVSDIAATVSEPKDMVAAIIEELAVLSIRSVSTCRDGAWTTHARGSTVSYQLEDDFAITVSPLTRAALLEYPVSLYGEITEAAQEENEYIGNLFLSVFTTPTDTTMPSVPPSAPAQ